MARKRTEILAIRPDVPVYPIGVAAKLLNVHPRTLRIYEKEGLVKPTLVGNRRMFSADDIQWITCLRTFIHEEGISIPGLKKLLDFIPCWEVAGCPSEIHQQCAAQVDRALPRTLHPAGDITARKEAKESDRQKMDELGPQKKSRSSG